MKGVLKSEFSNSDKIKLLASPYVANVLDKSIKYTDEFRELFWEQWCEGVSPVLIFESYGFDVKLLGLNRVYGLATILRRLNRKGLPITEGRVFSKATEPQKTAERLVVKMINRAEESDSGADFRKLQHQVAYMSQELEFLKKIILAANGEKQKR